MGLFNVASKPQLIHAHSKQSVTASDEYYYSLSSNESINGERATIRQYQTPPLRTTELSPSAHNGLIGGPNIVANHSRSAATSRDALQSEASVPSSRPVKNNLSTVAAPDPIAIEIKDNQTDEEKPSTDDAVSSHRTAAQIEISPTTPGLDDTPYIQFAIDQLTRDEELLGPRRQGVASEESYPVDRIVPDEGLGYYDHGRSPSEQKTRQVGNTKQPDMPGEFLSSLLQICVL